VGHGCLLGGRCSGKDAVARQAAARPRAKWQNLSRRGRKASYGKQPFVSSISQWLLVTYLDDVTDAMTRAKQAVGDKNVLVHGAALAQLALAAGVLDELELHVVPVLFGQGRRLFDDLAPEQIELEHTRVLEGEGGVTHMHYRVNR
jgi:hypothetical protein